MPWDWVEFSADPEPRGRDSPREGVGTKLAVHADMFLLSIPAFCITTVILLAFVVREAR
jgi:hypothetical protein